MYICTYKHIFPCSPRSRTPPTSTSWCATTPGPLIIVIIIEDIRFARVLRYIIDLQSI